MNKHAPRRFEQGGTCCIRLLALVVAASIAFASGPPPTLWMRGGHTDGVKLDVSADGELICSASWDFSVKLWRTAGEALLRTHPMPGPAMAAALSPDKQLLAATGLFRGLYFWNVADGELVRTIPDVGGYALCFSPDGTVIAVGSPDKPRIYRVSDGQMLLELLGQTWPIALCFSPDGQWLASASPEKTICIWNARDGTLAKVLTAHTDVVTDVRFSRNGEFLGSTGYDKTLRLWRVSDWSQLWQVTSDEPFFAADFSLDSRSILAGSVYGQIGKWRCADGVAEAVYKPDPNGDIVEALRILPQTDSFVAAYEYRIVRHGVSDLRPQSDLTGHSGPVSAVALSRTGGLAASTQSQARASDCVIRLRRATDGALVRTLPGHKLGGWALAFSHDGERLASGGVAENDRGELSLWRVSDGARLATAYGHAGIVNAVLFTPDDTQIISGSRDYTIKFWRVSDGQLQRTWFGHWDTINALALAPDGQWLASASSTGPPAFDGETLVWRLSDGAIVAILHGHTDVVTDTAFSPDGRFLATVSQDRAARLYRTSDWSLERTLSAHTGPTTSVRFSADSRSVIVGGFGTNYPLRNGEIRVWRVSGGTLLKTYDGETMPSAQTVDASAAGPEFLYGRDDGTVVMARNPHRLGDLNCDGRNTFSDINPFVLALTDRHQYESQYPACIWLNGDMTEDGDVGFEDINPFVELLSGE